MEDGVPGIGVRGPATPSLGDLAELLLGREAFGDGLTGDRGVRVVEWRSSCDGQAAQSSNASAECATLDHSCAVNG